MTLRRFLPARVIEGALADPLSLLGEPRATDATILISDVRGFTRWAEDKPPAQVLAFLNEVQGALAEAVRSQGGMVDKFLGDGMLAVFGAPEPLADHADHALRSALTMRETIADITARRVAAGDDPVQLGIGIHSGEVVAGCLGSGLRLEFTVIGDTVNTASRLEALTKTQGTDLLVSETCHRRLADASGLVRLGEVEVRGRQERLVVYTVPNGEKVS